MSNSLQPLDCSPQGSSYHGIFQARIWEWVVIDFSRGFSWPRDQTHVADIGRQIFFFSMVARIIFFFHFTALFYFILLYNIVLVLPHVNMNPPWAYACSPSWTPLPSPSPYHTSRSSQCTSPKHPVSNLGWRFISYILYMLQCHSPKSSHPLPLPQSPKVCSIHPCLFCCLAYRVIITIFLNSIYMR